MSAELLPCPFCGGEGRVHPMGPGAEGFFAASCTSPGCFVLNADFWGEVVATEAWNRRAPLSARPDESPSVSQDEQTASLLSRLKEAEDELANLREWRWSFDPLTLTHAMVVGLLAEVNDNDAGRDLAETLEAVRDNLTVAARDLQAAEAQIKVLEGALEWFIQHEKSLTLDVQSAHHSRGNGTTQWMTEDDREFRSDLRAAFDTARSALPQLGGENG